MKRKLLMIFLTIFFASILISCTNENNEEIEIDMEKFPNYIKNIETIDYSFNAETLRTPYWKGNVIYNETVLLIDEDNEISGKLLFSPLKILSVRDYSLEIEYIEGIDYTIENNVIKRSFNSKLPFLQEEQLKGQNIPSPYRKVTSISNVLTDYVLMGANSVYTESPFWYGNQLSVSYVYDVRDLDLAGYPDFDNSKLTKTISKLENKESLRITAIGDSVLEGCSSSLTFNRAPYMPDFMSLTKDGFERLYQTEIVLNNISVGGKTSAWGSNSTTITNLLETNPDLVFIHFGINDAGEGSSANSFRDHIELIILSLKAHNPEVEIIILTSFSPNPLVYDTLLFEKYWDKMYNLENIYQEVKIIDVWQLSNNILSVKKYEDVTGNGINHVNDYSSRLYLMSIMATLYKY